MIESKLTFFKMQVKGVGVHAAESGEPSFGKAPETLDAVYMRPPVSEFIFGMLHAIVLFVTQVHQAVVAAPAIGVDDTFRADLAPDHRLQRGFAAVRDDFGVDLAVALKDAENDRFAVSAATSFAANASGAEETFIDFDHPAKRRFALAKLGDLDSHFFQITVDRVTVEMSKFGDLRSI